MEDSQNQDGTQSANTPVTKKDYTKPIIIGVVVLAVLYGAQMMFSPERAMERAIEEAYEDAGVAVDIDRDGDTNVTFSGEDGESYTVSTGGDVSLPDNWPESVPVPSDAKITYAGTMTAGAPGGGTTVAFTTGQSVAEVTEYYKSELSGKGWTIAATMATADGSMVSATRAEGEGVILYVGTSPDGTTVSMTVQAQN